MLTPVDIQNKSFRSGGLGYDKKDVDAFMREVLKNYELMYRENMELNDKVTVLNEGIQNYKSIEKTLQKALVLAQKAAEETKAAAYAEARRVESEAHTKANIIIADAKNDLEKLHMQTVRLIQQYENYRIQFKNLAQSQFELLQSDAFKIEITNLDAFIKVSDEAAITEEQPPKFYDEHKDGTKKAEPTEESAPAPANNRWKPSPQPKSYFAQMANAEKSEELKEEDLELEDEDDFAFIDLNDNE